MGILLPPVPQASATTLTHHHRNRSLDSALQRIPEVDVTPSPECETTPAPVAKAAVPVCKARSREREDLASLGSDDSGILCGSDSGSSDATNAATRESSVDHLHSRESLDSSLSQPGDMDSVDAVDGEVNSAPVSVSVSVAVSPVELLVHSNSEPSTKRGDDDDDNDGGGGGGDDYSEPRKHENAISDALELRPGSSVCMVKEREAHELRVEMGVTVDARDFQKSLEVSPVNDKQSELAGAAMTLCCGTAAQSEINEAAVKKQTGVVCRRQETVQPKPSEGCLLRLFESQIFDMSMAISYLFNSKEPGVQSYLGKYLHEAYQPSLSNDW